MTGEVIVCNAFEDLFSPFSYLCYAQANDFDAFIFFPVVSRGNKLTYTIHFSFNYRCLDN